MTLNSYQKNLGNLLIPVGRNIVSTMLSIPAKAGELSARISKAIRFGQWMTTKNEIIGMNDNREANQRLEIEIKTSLGDCIARVSELCSFFGWDLEEVCQMSLDKYAKNYNDYKANLNKA